MNTQEYSGYHYVVYADNCNGYADQFAAWIEDNYPGIDVEIVPTNSLTDDHFFDPEGTPINDDLWERYCNS